MGEALENMINEIVASLKRDLEKEPDFDEEVLFDKVSDAVRDVRLRRNYGATTFDNAKIEADLENYYTVIKNLAAYDYIKRGADYESSHSEGDVARKWDNRDDILRSVHAFVQVL